MSTSFLPCKRKSLYHRVTIPKALRRFFRGRREVWRSLRTTDREHAHVQAFQLESKAKRVFFTLKRYGHLMDTEIIERMVTRWLNTALDEAEESWLLSGPVSGEEFEYRHDAIDTHHDSMYESLRGNDFQRMTTEADELLKSAGLPALDHGSQAFKKLCRRLLEAQLEYSNRLRDRLNGEYSPFAFSQAGKSGHNLLPVSSNSPPTKLFSEAVQRYFKENKPRSPRSRLQSDAELNTFLKVIGGDRPISHITKAECRKYKEHLQDERQLRPATVSKWLSVLHSIFMWAERQGHIPEDSNPMKGLQLSKKQAREGAESYREFTDEELLLTFGSEEFKAQRTEYPERFWICLLMLFQVCRRKEPAQLEVLDIQEEDGIPYIHIKHDGENQTTKTEASIRKVPIHSSLIQLGFLDYVHSIKAAGHIHLFPQLTRNKHHNLGDAVGKWFARLKKRKGLLNSNLALYSTRHTGITRMSNIGVPEKIAFMLTGHAAQGIHNKVYNRRERVSMKLLQEGLEKLQYPEVFKRLTVSPPEDSLLVA